jgi:hypothetical protein
MLKKRHHRPEWDQVYMIVGYARVDEKQIAEHCRPVVWVWCCDQQLSGVFQNLATASQEI